MARTIKEAYAWRGRVYTPEWIAAGLQTLPADFPERFTVELPGAEVTTVEPDAPLPTFPPPPAPDAPNAPDAKSSTRARKRAKNPKGTE
jgi:hypothetical protein